MISKYAPEIGPIYVFIACDNGNIKRRLSGINQTNVNKSTWCNRTPTAAGYSGEKVNTD